MNAREKLTSFMVAVIVVSFFMPWITVESSAVGDLTGLITGKKQSVLDSISGFRVPLLANSKESRFMISVIKIFNPQIRDADRKSYLLWCIPLIAVIIMLAGRVFKRVRVVRFILGMIALAIVSATCYKLLVTDLEKLILKVNIAYGLWLTIIGFFMLGIVELASALSSEATLVPVKDQTQALKEDASIPPNIQPTTPKEKKGKALLFKIIGVGLIIFVAAADWIKWGVLTGFNTYQILLIVAGIVFLIYGIAASHKL